jgi:hypothetical protein
VGRSCLAPWTSNTVLGSPLVGSGAMARSWEAKLPLTLERLLGKAPGWWTGRRERLSFFRRLCWCRPVLGPQSGPAEQTPHLHSILQSRLGASHFVSLSCLEQGFLLCKVQASRRSDGGGLRPHEERDFSDLKKQHLQRVVPSQSQGTEAPGRADTRGLLSLWLQSQQLCPHHCSHPLLMASRKSIPSPVSVVSVLRSKNVLRRAL